MVEPWQGNPGEWLWERIYGVQDARDILDPHQKTQRIRREMAPVFFVLRKGPWFWKEISHSEMPKEERGKTELGQIWGKARGSASPPGASCGICIGNRLT